MNETVVLDCHARTDTGKRRKHNEDAFLVCTLNKSLNIQQTSLSMNDQSSLHGGLQGHLFVIADGMGGHPAGDRASELAVRSIINYVLNTMPWFFNLNTDHEDDLRDELVSSLERCRENMLAEVEARPHLKGMGTTLTMAYLLWPRLYVVHAGHSRCYVSRDGELKLVTEDHTVAQQLVDNGAIEDLKEKRSRWSSVVWNVITSEDLPEPSPQVYKVRLDKGDTVLLCTDGLVRHVSDDEIGKIIAEDASAEEITEKLILAANDDGGSDNITAILIRISDLFLPDAA